MDKLNSVLIGFRLKTLPAVLGPLLIAVAIGFNNSVEIYRIALNLTFNNSQLSEGDRKVHMYAVNYNVLRIMSGMAGLAYSN